VKSAGNVDCLGVDESRRLKRELNSMRIDFNAHRWRATTEWANKKVLELKKAEESHDLGAIHRILRETGLSLAEYLFFKRQRILFGQHGSDSPGNQRTRSHSRHGKLCRSRSQCSNESQIGMARRWSRNQIYNLSQERFHSQRGRDHQDVDRCRW